MIDVVCSVPHSATRSLVKHLGFERNSPRGHWLHFGYCLDDPVLHKYHLHIPIRNPMEVARTWGRQAKNIEGLLKAYESMFYHLNIEHTLYKMEDMPRLDGLNDAPELRKDTAQVHEYQRIIQEKVVDKHGEFFERFY